VAKKSSLIKLRKPRLRLTSKGLKVQNVGVTVGGKSARVNVTPSGSSVSVGVPGATYNTRRGCLLSPFTLVDRLFKRRRRDS
jgi:hypothetical protein